MLHDFPLIVADESVDGRIIAALKKEGYSIFSIAIECKGISDRTVIEIAKEKSAFIITEDKDFGEELVYKNALPHIGCLLLRLTGLSIEVRIKLLIDVLAANRSMLQTSFSVLTAKKLRIRNFF